MKVAIHHRQGSFSDRWIEYCEQNSIDYKIVNAYDNDIVEQVSDCDVFMWHHHQAIMSDTIFARQLIYALETRGIRCFPDFHTTWHFDDKVGQKYLLEAICAQMVPSYVFYDKQTALKWVNNSSFPKVFKLRGGAGAVNVMLAKNSREARKLIKKSFGKGFLQRNIRSVLKEGGRKCKEGKLSVFAYLKDIAAYYLKPDTFWKQHAPERDYVYFQDFIPNNSYDIRVVVVGDKAFYLKRMVRKGDFRASGSGSIVYEKDPMTEMCVKLSFETQKKLSAQCIAYDYVINGTMPLIVEISYGFTTHPYDSCEGYYSDDMIFHPGKFNPQYWMIENLIKQIPE